MSGSNTDCRALNVKNNAAWVRSRETLKNSLSNFEKEEDSLMTNYKRSFQIFLILFDSVISLVYTFVGVNAMSARHSARCLCESGCNIRFYHAKDLKNDCYYTSRHSMTFMDTPCGRIMFIYINSIQT